jgi:hypothetical protein
VIRTQLSGASGLIGYSLDAHLARKTFWTLSAWDSQDTLDAFSHADPHRSRVNAIRPRMRPTTFRFWTVRGADLPVSWDEARRRIAAPSKPRPISREVRTDQPATPPAPGAPIRTFPLNRSNAHSNQPLDGICS